MPFAPPTVVEWTGSGWLTVSRGIDVGAAVPDGGLHSWLSGRLHGGGGDSTSSCEWQGWSVRRLWSAQAVPRSGLDGMYVKVNRVRTLWAETRD